VCAFGSLFSAILVLAGALIGAPAVAATAPPADWCNRLAPRLPSISLAECRHAGLLPTGASSLKGFPILLRDIPAKGVKEPLRVLLLGGIHGDELTASAIVFQWMEWIGTSPANSFHWRVAPVVNPDGLLATKPQRGNANGVDLNRNFPTPGWEKDAPVYWARRTGSDPRRYPGAAPLSEPETRWLNAEIERFRPQVIISVHAPYGVLDFDGKAKPPQRFGRLWFKPVGVFPGSLGNYGGVHKDVPVITIELPNAGTMPSDAETKRIWNDMLRWIGNTVAKKGAVKRISDTKR
jgi:protein MpaA